MKKHNGMRPLDIAVLLKIIAKGNESWQNKNLSNELFISASEISESLNRSMVAGLLDQSKTKVFSNSLLDFLQYGLKYVFPVQPGAIVKGIGTAHSAPVLSKSFVSDEQVVWQDAEGNTRGQLIEPLYPNAVKAAKIDTKLYDLLALCDAIRIGRVREVKVAIEKIQKIIKTTKAN